MLNTESKTTFSESVDDHSRAEVLVKLSTDSGYVSNSLSISVQADPNADEGSEVWLSMRVHDYAQLGEAWSAPTVSRGFDLVSQSFSRAEAEALYAVLAHELEKFKAYDEAEQPVFI
jgi:hypothetical protein